MSSTSRKGAKPHRSGPSKKDYDAGTTQVAYSTTDDENTLVANMTSILDKIIRDNAHAKRSKLSNAVRDLNQHLQYANSRHAELTEDGGDTARGLKSKLNKSVNKAHADFASEVQDIKAYLEDAGFTNMEGKLYKDNEIEAIVKPINEQSN